jgi:hypothetical protein
VVNLAEQRHEVAGVAPIVCAGEGVKRHEPEGPQVGAGLDARVLLRLLGGHEARRACHGGADRRGAALTQHACDAEIEGLHGDGRPLAAAPGEKHVRGLEVAVHDARAVRGGERVAQLLEDRRGLVGAEGGALHAVLEGLAVEVLHGHPGLAGGGLDARGVHLHHVVALDARAHLRLALEVRAELLAGGRVGEHHLEGDA